MVISYTFIILEDKRIRGIKKNRRLLFIFGGSSAKIVGYDESVVSSLPCVRMVAISSQRRDLGQILHSELPDALRRVESDTVSML